VGFPAGPAEAAPGHQLSIRRSPLPGRPLFGAGIILLRVHRDEVAEVEVEIYEGRRALVLLRRSMADILPKKQLRAETMVRSAIAALLSDCHRDPVTPEIPDPTIEVASNRRAAARTEPALRQGMAFDLIPVALD